MKIKALMCMFICAGPQDDLKNFMELFDMPSDEMRPLSPSQSQKFEIDCKTNGSVKKLAGILGEWCTKAIEYPRDDKDASATGIISVLDSIGFPNLENSKSEGLWDYINDHKEDVLEALKFIRLLWIVASNYQAEAPIYGEKPNLEDLNKLESVPVPALFKRFCPTLAPISPASFVQFMGTIQNPDTAAMAHELNNLISKEVGQPETYTNKNVFKDELEALSNFLERYGFNGVLWHNFGGFNELAGTKSEEEFKKILDTPEVKAQLEILFYEIGKAWEESKDAE